MQPEALTLGYLNSIRGLEGMGEDTQLIGFLSNDIDTYNKTISMYGKVQRESIPRGSPVLNAAYSRSEVMDILREAGLREQSWVPTAYSHPYGEYCVRYV